MIDVRSLRMAGEYALPSMVLIEAPLIWPLSMTGETLLAPGVVSGPQAMFIPYSRVLAHLPSNPL